MVGLRWQSVRSLLGLFSWIIKSSYGSLEVSFGECCLYSKHLSIEQNKKVLQPFFKLFSVTNCWKLCIYIDFHFRFYVHFSKYQRVRFGHLPCIHIR